MLIFLYGPDDYRRLEKKNQIVDEFVKKRSVIGFETFDFEVEDGIDQFEEFAANQSIFGNAKLAAIQNVFEVEPKKLVMLLSPFVARADIHILLSEREKPVKALSFLIEEPVFFQKFEILEGSSWISFIAKELKSVGLSLDPAALEFLGTVYQGNSWALVTEIRKLSTFFVKNKTATKQDLDAFDLESAPNYWSLITALKSSDPKNRLGALEKMLALGDPAAKIFNILASQWQEKISKSAELDFAVKSGKLEYEEAVLELVLG